MAKKYSKPKPKPKYSDSQLEFMSVKQLEEVKSKLQQSKGITKPVPSQPTSNQVTLPSGDTITLPNFGGSTRNATTGREYGLPDHFDRVMYHPDADIAYGWVSDTSGWPNGYLFLLANITIQGEEASGPHSNSNENEQNGEVYSDAVIDSPHWNPGYCMNGPNDPTGNCDIFILYHNGTVIGFDNVYNSPDLNEYYTYWPEIYWGEDYYFGEYYGVTVIPWVSNVGPINYDLYPALGTPGPITDILLYRASTDSFYELENKDFVFNEMGFIPNNSVSVTPDDAVYGLLNMSNYTSPPNAIFTIIRDDLNFVPFVPSADVSVNYNLHEGANLIGIPLYLEDSSLSLVFGVLGDNVTGVTTEGGAGLNIGGGTWVGSLTEIKEDKGYWVMVDQPVTLSITGEPATNLTYDLHTGANLISFTGVDETAVDVALDGYEDVISGVITEGVATINIGGGTWIGSLTTFERDIGYWVIALQDIPNFQYGTPQTQSTSSYTYMNVSLPPNLHEANINEVFQDVMDQVSGGAPISVVSKRVAKTTSPPKYSDSQLEFMSVEQLKEVKKALVRKKPLK